MNIFRKSIAVLILLFIAIPILFSIIWGVGITRAVVSQEFLADLPSEIIDKVPDMIDEILLEMDREDMMRDPKARGWVKAIANSDTSPKELMEKIGVTAWMKNELANSFTEMSQMVRGEIPIRPIILDLRPLKKALQHEAIAEYLTDILKNMPTCSEDQINEWVDAAETPRDLKEIPPCCPTDPTIANAAIRYMQKMQIDEIPDEINMVEGDDSFPQSINVARTVTHITYLLFLLPAIFLILAALIGGDGKIGFFKWMGVSTVIGGGITWAMAAMISKTIPWSITIGPDRGDLTPFENLMWGKSEVLGSLFVDRLLNGVETVAGIVCIIGIVFFALSFLLPEPEDKGGTNAPPSTSDNPKTIDAPVTDSAIKPSEE